MIENNQIIKGYNPFEKIRAFKSIYIPNEDFIDNQKNFLKSYYKIFHDNKKISIIDGYVNKIKFIDRSTKEVVVNNKHIIISKCGFANGAFAQNLINQLKIKNIPKLFFGSGNAFIATYEKKLINKVL